jgi:hypothetical protein
VVLDTYSILPLSLLSSSRVLANHNQRATSA